MMNMKYKSLPREFLPEAKWTSLKVQDRMKHFNVIHVDCRDEIFVLEHVLSKRHIMVPYLDLKNKTLWKQGWL